MLRRTTASSCTAASYLPKDSSLLTSASATYANMREKPSERQSVCYLCSASLSVLSDVRRRASLRRHATSFSIAACRTSRSAKSRLKAACAADLAALHASQPGLDVFRCRAPLLPARSASVLQQVQYLRLRHDHLV